MKLSKIFPQFYQEKYTFINEREIETLALAVADLDVPFCTFVTAEEYLEHLSENVKMIITTSAIAQSVKEDAPYGLCLVDNPKNVFFKLHNYLGEHKDYARTSSPTSIGSGTKISHLAVIADQNVSIGRNCLIEEFAVIRENTIIGDNCIIRSGVKIGGSDFEFKRDGETIFGVNHYGGVIIGNDVEVQYNSGINRALYPWDNTVIGDYTKVDMLVHLAHGCKVGKSCMIVANSGIGGRVEIGDDSWIGFASTIRNGLKIGRNCRINMGSVVTKDVPDGMAVSGNFAIDHEKFLAYMKNLVK